MGDLEDIRGNSTKRERERELKNVQLMGCFCVEIRRESERDREGRKSRVVNLLLPN